MEFASFFRAERLVRNKMQEFTNVSKDYVINLINLYILNLL